MDITNPLPTTCTDVDADLRARADFRGVDKAGQVHYLLGMCEALLAEANAEIMRARKAAANSARLADALRDCAELLDDYSDVNYGEDGPRPNRAMSMLQRVKLVLSETPVR